MWLQLFGALTTFSLFSPNFSQGGWGHGEGLFIFFMSFILEHWQSFIYLFLLLLLPTPHASFQEVMCLETMEAVTTPQDLKTKMTQRGTQMKVSQVRMTKQGGITSEEKSPALDTETVVLGVFMHYFNVQVGWIVCGETCSVCECVRTCACTSVCRHVCVCVCACLCACITFSFVCVCVCVCACITFSFVCVCVCVCACITLCV